MGHIFKIAIEKTNRQNFMKIPRVEVYDVGKKSKSDGVNS